MYNMMAAGEKVLATLRLELFRTLLMQRLSFFDRHTTAQLTSLISVELDAVRSFIFKWVLTIDVAKLVVFHVPLRIRVYGYIWTFPSCCAPCSASYSSGYLVAKGVTSLLRGCYMGPLSQGLRLLPCR